MSLPTDITEEKKMVEFLKTKGITTLEQLKVIFKNSQDETVEEEVVFVKQVAGPSISQEKMNLLIEASTRNKEKLLDVLSKTTNTAENLKPQSQTQPQPPNQKKVVGQSNVIAELGHSVVNAVNAVNVASFVNNGKNETSLPLRYRHKNCYQNSRQPTKPTRSNCKLQQRERIRQAAKQNELQKMALGVNIQYNEFNQYPQCINQPLNQSAQNQCPQYNEHSHHNQQPICNTNTLNNHTLQGMGQNIPGVYNNTSVFNNSNDFSSSTRFNNDTGFSNDTGSNNTTNYNNHIGFNHANDFNNGTRFNKPTGFNNATAYNNAKNFKTTIRFDNSIGQTIQVAQPMVPTTVYNGSTQQTWPTATSLQIGPSYNDNFMRFELATQTQSQQTSAQYMLGHRPVFDPI